MQQSDMLTNVCWDAALTYGAVGRSPAGQTFTVSVPVVTGGVVGAVHTHFRTQFAIVAMWTDCNAHHHTGKVKSMSIITSISISTVYNLGPPWSQSAPV